MGGKSDNTKNKHKKTTTLGWSKEKKCGINKIKYIRKKEIKNQKQKME